MVSRMQNLKQVYWRIREAPQRISSSYRRAWRRLEPKGPHAWLFGLRLLSRVIEKVNYWELPWPQKLFWVYAHVFINVYNGKLPFGDKVFHGLSTIGAVFSRQPYYSITIDGYKLYLASQDPRAFQVINELIDIESDANKLRHFLGRGDTFIDIGANHGIFSLVASDLVCADGMVICIEPQPLLSIIIDRNLQDNGKGNFRVLNCACGDHEGWADLFVPRGSSGAAGIYRTFSGVGKHDSYRVTLKRLDDIVSAMQLPGSIFVKLDVEGSELAVLRGAQSLLVERKPKLMIEINVKAIESIGLSIQDYISFLKKVGYTSFVWLDEPLKIHNLDILNNLNVSLTNIVVIK